jgi:hypothetical protein
VNVHLIKSVVFLILALYSLIANAEDNKSSYIDARWDPLHFKPAINQATNDQCLACHQEIITSKPLAKMPAGVEARDTKAWYQLNDHYNGVQDTFHRRHLVTPLAKRLMSFKCNTCHQGNNPNTEVVAIDGSQHGDPNLNKQVDTDICLMCHGTFDYKVMSGLSGDWPDIRESFNNDCVTCHKEFRTRRHEVNFLKAEAIEQEGEKNKESCYGCHGERAWYSIPYPYVRRPWLERMPGMVPEWAEGRPVNYPKHLRHKDDEIGLTALPEWVRKKLKTKSTLMKANKNQNK